MSMEAKGNKLLIYFMGEPERQKPRKSEIWAVCC